MARLAGIVLLAAFTGALVSGCLFPTDSGNAKDDPPDWKMRDTPQHVLENLVTAYEHEDVEHYLDCLAEDFTFTVNPDEVQFHPELLPGYWDKTEERAIHELMLGESGAHAITLTLTQDGDPIPIEGPEPEDPPQWQYKESVDLWVDVFIPGEGPVTFVADTPSLFQFREDADQLGPNGETLWEIVCWYDLPAPDRVPAPVEPRSWAGIKALYR